VFEWYAKQFGDFKNAFDLEDCMDNLINDAAKVSVGSAGLIFLPYLQGERAPIWNANAKGVYFGLNINHQQQHLFALPLKYSIMRSTALEKHCRNIVT
jgi:gluconokinase